MPLSQYKKKDLYRHVETFELADPKLFEDAVITEDLCICVLKKNIVDRYTWQGLVLKSVDQSCVELYKWNVTKTDLNNGQIAFVFSIHFNTKLAKDNFAKWWYYGRKGERLAGKVVPGVPLSSISGSVSFVIPQIDWENIHINQKELWDKGDYDNAVLAEMGLKMENGVIVKC